MKRKIIIFTLLITLGFVVFKRVKKIEPNTKFEIGQAIESLNHVKVFYNGGVDHVLERNVQDGYNIGLKYQCVEFVKRYYYEHLSHKMPDSYGHAVSFFDKTLADNTYNKQRDLWQYTNPSILKPKVGDLVIFDGTPSNKYGHVAIISNVSEDEIEIIQQNPGPFAPSRVTISLTTHGNDYWKIENDRILGWLRKK